MGGADAGDDLAHEFFESAFAGFVFGFGAFEGLLPGGGEAGGLFAHAADGIFGDLELADFGAAGLVLQRGEVDAEVFVLGAEFVEIFLEGVVAGGVDLELGVEVSLEFAAFGLEAVDFAL